MRKVKNITDLELQPLHRRTRTSTVPCEVYWACYLSAITLSQTHSPHVTYAIFWHLEENHTLYWFFWFERIILKCRIKDPAVRDFNLPCIHNICPQEQKTITYINATNVFPFVVLSCLHPIPINSKRFRLQIRQGEENCDVNGIYKLILHKQIVRLCFSARCYERCFASNGKIIAGPSEVPDNNGHNNQQPRNRRVANRFNRRFSGVDLIFSKPYCSAGCKN